MRYLIIAIALLGINLRAQESTRKSLPGENRDEAFSLDFGGFTNFVNNNYGHWSGGDAKIMYRGKRFSPSLSYAYQRRPEGHQSTIGFDSYVNFNRWFYVAGGIGGAPVGTSELYPTLRYGITGFFTIPGNKGLVATLGASQVHNRDESHSRTLSAGALYYRGKAIASGSISFNRAYPGAHPSKSGALAIQYGAQNRYWIGAGMSGGNIAYQTISLSPLNVQFQTYGPNIFLQKWITGKFGFILKYDYQNQLESFRRHGISTSLFIEFP
jgi:YaiO family outer membrane protein